MAKKRWTVIINLFSISTSKEHRANLLFFFSPVVKCSLQNTRLIV